MKKTTKDTSRLSLHRSTLRLLRDSAQQQIAGGRAEAPTATIEPSGVIACPSDIGACTVDTYDVACIM
jgi:hypothetical protein